MSENSICLKSINELLKCSFFIPSYQRGYRWEKQQVEDLLNDISQFNPKEIENSQDKTWYCLQPLVIKKCNEKIKSDFNLSLNSDWYEVIDGQQRLTTVFLIVHYINEILRGKLKLKEIELKYQTREKSEEFLKQLKIDEETNDLIVNAENVDFYHISDAYKTIHNWFKTKINFDTNNYESKFIFSTKVIWYETLAIDSIAIFTRINMGKIPLTNAELIKALFLNSSNFKNADPDKIWLKQLEIASEWDRIEYSLQNESFWCFLNKSTNPLITRIEFVFDLMSRKQSNSDEYFTFRYFNNKFNKKSEEEFNENWQDIKRYYQILEEWFTDRLTYHKIGFLITTGTSIRELIASIKGGKSKTQFKKILDGLISDKVNVQLKELEYPSGIVKNVLLLHNIITVLNNDHTNRFPFDRYINEKWDIEHISAVSEKIPNTEKHKKDWLEEASEFLPNGDLKNKSKVYREDTFLEIYNEILDYFIRNEENDDTNNISNLTLLDVKTNRGYGNAVYPVKRSKIIEKDKKGTFIPICTKNIFMKFYNHDVLHMTFWSKDDREAYIKDIKETLKEYLPKQIITNNEHK